MRYGIMDEAYRLEEGKIGNCIIVFESENICRGYEISLKKGEINLRMPLPTSDDDIYFFYEYIKKLCKKMHTKTFIRDEEEINFDQIDTCIEMDIKASKNALKQIEEDIENGKYENMYIFGAINPVAIGKKELEKIEGDVHKLGNLMNNLQKTEAYYAAPSLYQRKDNSYFATYTLTAEVPSILPYKAKLLMIEKDYKVKDWYIGFVIKDKIEGFIAYQDFLDSIKKEKEYDTEHFITTIEEKEIKELVHKYKVEL